MSVIFRATEAFLENVRRDLVRPHAFAAERVGFISARATEAEDSLVILAENYRPVADSDYIYDPSVGAMIGQEGFRKELEVALLEPVGIFHVHMHLYPGRLWFSRTDLDEQDRFVPDFFRVRPSMPHGALVLSPYNVAGRVWLGPAMSKPISEFNVVGHHIRVTHAANDGSTDFRP